MSQETARGQKSERSRPTSTRRVARIRLPRQRGGIRGRCWCVFVLLRALLVHGASALFVLLLRWEIVLLRGASGKRAGRCWCVGEVLLARRKARRCVGELCFVLLGR